jgi:hypothetical protein
VRRVAGVSGRTGSDWRCVGVWTAEVKRAVRRVAGVSGRCGQVGGASGCRPLGLGRRCVWLQAVGVRWEVLQDEHGGGSGGRCFGMSAAGVRREVCWAERGGG